MAQVIIAARIKDLLIDGVMDVTQDVTFINCYWPRLSEPKALFTQTSTKIKVQGIPTPRNVVFPPSAKFLHFFPDAHAAARRAYDLAFSGRPFVNLEPEHIQVYMDALAEAERLLVPTASRVLTRGDCFFIGDTELTVMEARKHAERNK